MKGSRIMQLPPLPPMAARLISRDEIVPVTVYADPVLATHLDGSAIGCEVIPHKWMPRGTVMLVDADGDFAFDRYHSENTHIDPKPGPAE